MSYSIKMVCEKTGLTSHTLRYYEKEGLLGNISRSKGGERRYTDADLESLALICCLKNTGMSLSDISEFLSLTRKGDETLEQRCEILKKRQQKVIEHIDQTEMHLKKVKKKIEIFSDMLEEYKLSKGK